MSGAEPEAGRPWRLRARRGGGEPERTDRGLRLQAEREWLLSAPAEIIADVQAALPRHAEGLGADTLLLHFGNAVGRLELPHLGPVEVVSFKWGEETFDRMLADLVEVVASLPFSANDGPALPFATSPDPAPRVDYHAFLYLRHVLSDAAPRADRLLPALELVLRDPDRRMERTTVRTPLEAVSRADASTVAAIPSSALHRPAAGTARRAAPGVVRLMERLGGHLPGTVLESRVRSEVDTPENRFVLRFLNEARRIVARVEALARARPGAFGRRLERDAERCGALLDRVRRAPLWTEVGEAHHLHVGSTVLRGRRGYRDVLGHWVRMRRTAELPLDEERATALVEAKDIALLYELWCYFEVVRALKEELGPTERASRVAASPWEVGVPHEFQVRWKGVRLCYNGRFSRSRRGLRHAYSTPLRPDIVLEDRRGERPVVHLLDAKFRVEARVIDGREVLSFKRADLHRMHAYRDAITGCETAWVVYPGEETAYFPVEGAGQNQGVGVMARFPKSRMGSGSDLEILNRLVVEGVSGLCCISMERSGSASREGPWGSQEPSGGSPLRSESD